MPRRYSYKTHTSRESSEPASSSSAWPDKGKAKTKGKKKKGSKKGNTGQHKGEKDTGKSASTAMVGEKRKGGAGVGKAGCSSSRGGVSCKRNDFCASCNSTGAGWARVRLRAWRFAMMAARRF